MTVWQRLGKVFGPNATLDQQSPVFKFDKKELLKTDNKEEFEKQKLQAQQSYYLGQQWAKIENNLYTQAIYYEPTRLASYYDYESMEYTPEISTALDIYAEESTTTNEDGFILQIYSESSRIKGVLADLFNNRLDINTNLPMWTRNTCKYGDNFIYLKLDPEKGIVGCQQLPNIEIERLERGMAAKAHNVEGTPSITNIQRQELPREMAPDFSSPAMPMPMSAAEMLPIAESACRAPSAPARTFAPGGNEQELIAVANPLSAKFEILRPSLIPGLLESVAHNRRHGRRDVSLFEIGARFTASTRAARFSTICVSPKLARPNGTWMMPPLSVRYCTWPAFAFLTAVVTSGVTVPTLGFGISPRGPRIWPS